MVVHSLVGSVYLILILQFLLVAAVIQCVSGVLPAVVGCPGAGDTLCFSFKCGEAHPTPNLPGSTRHGSFAKRDV